MRGRREKGGETLSGGAGGGGPTEPPVGAGQNHQQARLIAVERAVEIVGGRGPLSAGLGGPAERRQIVAGLQPCPVAEPAGVSVDPG